MKQNQKAKKLENAIEKLKKGEPLTDKETSLCIKILSREIIIDAEVNTAEMDEWFGGWRHICPVCKQEVITEKEEDICPCGQHLSLPPFGKWSVAFRQNHIWNEAKGRWTENAIPQPPQTEEQSVLTTTQRKTLDEMLKNARIPSAAAVLQKPRKRIKR